MSRALRAVLPRCVVALLLLSIGATACGGQESSVRVMVPNTPGGGYDTTARTLANTWEESDLVDEVMVFNLPGASGLVGLSRLQREAGQDDLLLMMGLGVVGAMGVTRSELSFDDVTPLARILTEPNVILVRADSSIQTMPEFVRRWRERPDRLRFGGGSLPGGPDHLATFAVAEALNIAPQAVRYRSYDGGGPLLAALVADEIDVVVSGVLETIDHIRSGAVVPLAVTGPTRLPDIKAPTLRESGVDVVFENWRGLLAPPGLSDAQRDRLIDLVLKALDSTPWRESEDRNGWQPDVLVGAQFAEFLESEVRRTRRLLRESAQKP